MRKLHISMLAVLLAMTGCATSKRIGDSMGGKTGQYISSGANSHEPQRTNIEQTGMAAPDSEIEALGNKKPPVEKSNGQVSP